MENIFVEFLPPWIETGLQPAFYDKESGTVLQQTARMYARVNMLIRMFNKLSKNTKTEIESFENTVNETVNEYIEKFNQLHDYVEDYFDNLDVQEEINNKLDAMVEAGTLQEIITAYIQANVAWTFDTVADMKLADNLINGSYARTLGFYTANDGGGALYRITNTGTANEVNIIAVNNSLLANLVYDTVSNIKQFGCHCDDTTDDSTTLQTGINNMPSYVTKLIFNNEGDMLLSDEIKLNNLANLTFEFTGKIHRASANSTENTFTMIQSSDLSFVNPYIYSERTKSEPAPAGHSRISSLGSNINGFYMKNCNNIRVEKCTFENMSMDFINQPLTSENLAVSKNIYITNWKSTNASQPLFMQCAENIYIDNADLTPATDMGNGDHHLYLARLVKNVLITNSTFTSPDTNYGVSLLFANTGSDNSNTTCPKGLNVINCKFYLYQPLVTLWKISDATFEQCYIKPQYNSTDYTLFVTTDNPILKFNNNIIDGDWVGWLFYSAEGTQATLTNNVITNARDTLDKNFMSFGNTVGLDPAKLVMKYNTFDYKGRTVCYAAGSGSFDISYNTIHTKRTTGSGNAYTFSFRKANSQNVNITHNDIISGNDTGGSLIYTSGTANVINCFYNLISGYNAVANEVDLPLINNNYNVVQ